MQLLKDKEGNLVGVGPDAPMRINENGGKQSALPYRCDLLPPRALLAVANVLDQGAKKYGEDNWRKIAIRDHVNHVVTHLLAWLDSDESDFHLSHAACRALFALDLEEREAGYEVNNELGHFNGVVQ